MKTLKSVSRILIFVLVFILIFQFFTAFFFRRTKGSPWDQALKIGGFYREDKNSIEVLGLGTSHMYCTLNPDALWHDTGIRSYVLASQQQPLDITYYYLKDALKRQSPSVVIVEAVMTTDDHKEITSAVIHDAVDWMRPGINRLSVIHKCAPIEDRPEYILPLIKYHSRWKDLAEEDSKFEFRTETDPFHGYVFLTDSSENHCRQISYSAVDAVPPDSDTANTLLSFRELAEKEGFQLLLLLAPYAEADENIAKLKGVSEFCAENRIDFLDLNTVYDSLGIDNNTDYYDSGHFNVYGSEKATDYIARYLSDHYHLIGSAAEDPDWVSDYDYYLLQKEAAEKDS